MALVFTACGRRGVASSGGIVSLSPAMTELVCQLGQGSRLVGRTDACDYPESVLQVPVAGKFGDPNVERILGMNPSLLVANDLINPNQKQIFEAAGIKVLLMPVRTVDDYYACVASLGESLGCPESAAAEIKRCKAKFAELSTMPPIDASSLFAVWDDPLMVCGRGSFPDTVLSLVGIRNAAGKVDQEYFRCSYEWLRENPPDIMVVSHEFPSLSDNPNLADLPCVKEKRIVVPENESAILRPGPRLPDAIASLRKQLEQATR